MAADPDPSTRRPLRLDAAARRAWLIRTLGALAPEFSGEIGDDTALAEGGLGLDSLGLIDLITAIEDLLGVTVEEHEITGEHFRTVGRLLGFLGGRLSEA